MRGNSDLNYMAPGVLPVSSVSELDWNFDSRYNTFCPADMSDLSTSVFMLVLLFLN